jgi:hypothetical protein
MWRMDWSIVYEIERCIVSISKLKNKHFEVQDPH